MSNALVWMTNGSATVQTVEDSFYDVWQARGWTLSSPPGGGPVSAAPVKIVGAPSVGQAPVWDGTEWAPGVPGNGTSVPTVGSYSYNGDGTVSSTPDGTTYTYNSDGTVHTVSKGGVTRTYAYNSDGSVAGVS